MLLRAEYVIPITAKPIKSGAVLVSGDSIIDVGLASDLMERYPGEEVRDFGMAAILPGLVDAHTHLDYSVMRGLVHDVPYVTWLSSMRAKAKLMTREDWIASSFLGGLEALSAGITCVADITTTCAPCAAINKIGLRGVVYREVSALDKASLKEEMKEAEEDVLRMADQSDSARISVGLSPATSYRCHPAVYGAVSEMASDYNIPVAMRLAGSPEECNFLRYGSSALSLTKLPDDRGAMSVPPWLPTGTTPVAYAANWGAFEAKNVIAIHCVQMTDEDIKLLARYDVAIATCPRSNAKLGNGTAPIGEFRRMGLRVGLGTSSPAASDSIDMFGEMNMGLYIQRACNVGTFMDASTMLDMATIDAARALKMEDRIGSLEAGKLADITVVNLSGSAQIAEDDPVYAIVNHCTASDVMSTMVGGKMLYEQKKWNLDVEVARTVAKTIEIRRKIRAV